MSTPRWLMTLILACTGLPMWAHAQQPGTLQQKLLQEPTADLAKAARQQGDAGRGAVLFFQPMLGCAKCHDHEAGTQAGPDLSKMGKDATAEYLVESVLLPSKVLKKGYETINITLTNGKTITGLLVAETKEQVTLLDPSGSKPVNIPSADIEQRTVGKVSLMPEGMMNFLSDRQQFLDLVRYLIEIAEHGPTRAKELRPANTTLVLPEYEKVIDHTGLIKSLDAKALQRGEAVYSRICANCHGTKEHPGSLPTSPKFLTHVFKNGSDPYSLYQTLTRGYGMMPPQTWMVPQQKYDVIHYVRETYLKGQNPTQYTTIDQAYLAKLPKGNTFGPAPVKVEPWVTMDYGPSLINTYEIGGTPANIAYKGIALRLDSGAGGVSRGKTWAVFDHDTMRLAAAWSGEGFIDWKGIHFNGQHQIHPKLVGERHVENPVGPGWANPATGQFNDPRLLGRDNRPYGPLPRSWAKYKGLYAYGDQTIMSYTVGETDILELVGMEINTATKGLVFTRTLEMSPRRQTLFARIAPETVAVTVLGDAKASIVKQDGFHVLRLEATDKPGRVKVLMAKGSADELTTFAKTTPAPRALKPLTEGGPRRWPEVLKTTVTMGNNDGPFAVDTFLLPDRNPWNAQLRLTGFDFFPDGKRMAVCSWDGDVWVVSGLDQLANGLTWQRIASGLFQPLGLKFRDGGLFVTCRDQIVQLHDRNGDGETDFYECFNNDHQVTEHFHEFAMGLQVDQEGNFYYAKSGRHALPALVPHHGTLLKVSKDGSTTEILATGFRAANGVCLNPDGTFFVTDQEGFWTPKNRINLVTKGGFYGNMWGYTTLTDTADSAMKQPLCWITNQFDRSPAELVWVNSKEWRSLNGALLNISYGHGKIYVVPHETIAGQAQGGMCALPLPPFPTGIMRGRFHPLDGQLYTCGMYSWAGNQTQAGGFYRVRATGRPMHLPTGLQAKFDGIELTFTDALKPDFANDPKNYEIKVWGLKRSQNYGSKHIDEKPLTVTKATLAADQKTLRLVIPDLQPTWGMEIKYRLQRPDGQPVTGTIHNTIHALPNK